MIKELRLKVKVQLKVMVPGEEPIWIAVVLFVHTRLVNETITQ